MTYPNLKAEMARQGLTGEQVAKTANVSEITFSKWMNDKGEPTISACRAIAAQLGHSVDYLFATEPITPSA